MIFRRFSGAVWEKAAKSHKRRKTVKLGEKPERKPAGKLSGTT
jgi:hypothetical protein